MPRADFHRELDGLQESILVLGSMVEKAVIRSVEALKNRDLETSRQIILADDLIDRKRFEIEDHCIEVIARQQPMATDLRTIITLLHINVELERIGDYAEGISKICLMIGDEPPLKPLIDIPRMADKSTDMLRRSLTSLVERDVEAARKVCNDDDEVDALYDRVFRDLLTIMIQDPQGIQRGTYLLWVAHDLERIGDRTTNIAERVVYLVTGTMEELNSSKY